MTILLWALVIYAVVAALFALAFGGIAHGQGEPNYIREGLKMGALWPYWAYKFVKGA